MLLVTQTIKNANFTINMLTVLFSYLFIVDLFTTRTKFKRGFKSEI